MNNLQLIEVNGVYCADSREVAEMVEKDHSKLIRDIRTYCDYLNEAKIGLVDFFSPTAYTDIKGEERPCYYITRKGCDMIANKMTGQKGVLFTAAYVTKFEQMEHQIQNLSPQIDSRFLFQIAAQMEEKENRIHLLETTTAQQNQIIGELKPKANYVDAILNNKGLVTITQISKDYGMSGQAMNDLLHEHKVQFKQSGQWLLYEPHQAKGYTHSNTIPIEHKDGTKDVTMQTKWTQKGRLFIYDLLKSNGILPVIER